MIWQRGNNGRDVIEQREQNRRIFVSRKYRRGQHRRSSSIDGANGNHGVLWVFGRWLNMRGRPRQKAVHYQPVPWAIVGRVDFIKYRYGARPT